MFVHGLYLGGRPIALRWNLVSPPGSFFFKPGYDEAYSAYSPGVHVELETIRYLHRRPDIAWMDSCTDPDNELINKLWLDRKIIQSLVIAPGRQTGQLAISALPMLRWLKRLVRRR